MENLILCSARKFWDCGPGTSALWNCRPVRLEAPALPILPRSEPTVRHWRPTLWMQQWPSLPLLWEGQIVKVAAVSPHAFIMWVWLVLFGFLCASPHHRPKAHASEPAGLREELARHLCIVGTWSLLGKVSPSLNARAGWHGSETSLLWRRLRLPGQQSRWPLLPSWAADWMLQAQTAWIFVSHWGNTRVLIFFHLYLNISSVGSTLNINFIRKHIWKFSAVLYQESVEGFGP